MDNRIVEFIRGLRAAGVRVSLAESLDALDAIGIMGIRDKGLFRASLRATLVKERKDFQAFEELFPLYFGSGGPPLQSAYGDMSEDEQKLLEAALSGLSGRIQGLLDWLTSGEGPTKEELEQMAKQAGVDWFDSPDQARWVTRRMMQQMGFGQLEEKLAELVEKLQAMGMSDEAIQKLLGVVEANREALVEQMAQQVGLQIAQERARRPDDLHGSDLMHKPLDALSEREVDMLRDEVKRLVAQLRSRAALRRRRGHKGKFDARGTIRANQRYGGVPIELKMKKRKLKPSLVLICDVSESMRYVVEFMMTLTYQLQDQVSKARSFAFYYDLVEITSLFSRSEVDIDSAFSEVRKILPYRPYGTDLGGSLEVFYDKHLSAVNHRTTVVMVGDGRNNYNPARVDLVRDLQKRGRRLIWLTPETHAHWGTGDSDMMTYAPVCDDVVVVRNLAQLASAVDKLLAGD